MASPPAIPNIPVNFSFLTQMTNTGLLPANLVEGEDVLLQVVEKLTENQYRLTLKGSSITITSDLPLNAGDKFQARVQALQPQLVLQVTDTQKQGSDVQISEGASSKRVASGPLIQVLNKAPVVSGNANVKVSTPPLQLSEGQTLTGTVQEKLPGNQYLMNLKGTTLMIKSDAPLMAGDKFQVRVQSVAPQVILQVMEPHQQSADVKMTESRMQKSGEPGFLISTQPKSSTASESVKTYTPPALQLSQGQTLSVTVQEKLPGNQYLMAVKDVVIAATSDIPLKEGDRLQVKVQSLQPQIILNVTDARKQSTDAKIHERLVQWRLNTDALPQILIKKDEVVQNLKTIPLPSGFSEKDMDVLVNLLRNIVLSAKTRMNPSFVKDFVSQSGLMLEKDLAALVSSKPSESVPLPQHNLKTVLLKLSEALSQVAQDTKKLDPAIAAKVTELVSFTNDTLKTVEARQAVNVVYQQNENGLYLQIPLALGETFRQADIFITPDDKKAQGPDRFASCAIRLFLDMDYLGELSIEAALREGRFRCVIQCEREDVRKLVEEASGQLRDALTGIGYHVDQVDCLKSTDLKRKRTDFIDQRILGSAELVNSFV